MHYENLLIFICILNQYIYVAYYYYIGATNNTESWGYYADARYSDRGVGDPVSPLLNIVINKT